MRLVNELCVWYATQDTRNPLGYPSQSVEARAGRGRGPVGVARSLVPTHQLPAHLSPVERAMNQMPEDMRLAVLARHLADFPWYHEQTGNSRSTYYNQADSGYWFIAGVVNHALG